MNQPEPAPRFNVIAAVVVLLTGIALCCVDDAASQGLGELDLSDAVIVSPPGQPGPAVKAAAMLAEEVASKSWARWPQRTEWPGEERPVIVVGVASELEGFAGTRTSRLRESENLPADGFRIWIEDESGDPVVYVSGNDARGTLYGVGYLLRKLRLGREVSLPASIDIETSPEIPLRGHQLGYRPKTNSYDGFDAEMWEQYIRDLVVFGANAIELMPPNTDDAGDSPLFPDSQLDMMIAMDEILQEYDLEAWIWYPLMHGDYTERSNVEASLAENEMIFSKLPKIDALFIPGGDPGHTKPDVLFDYLEKQADILHSYHPRAEIWISPQGFDGSGWMNSCSW